MANITNATKKPKVFKPLPLGSKRDRRTSLFLIGMSKLDWRLISYGLALTISLAYFFSIALEKGGY